jgi:hypothetical protein
MVQLIADGSLGSDDVDHMTFPPMVMWTPEFIQRLDHSPQLDTSYLHTCSR